MELNSVVLAVHEMESCVNQSSIYGAHNLLSRRWPLPFSGSLYPTDALKDQVYFIIHYNTFKKRYT